MKQRLIMLLFACCIVNAGMAQDKPKTGLGKILNKADTLLKKVNEKIGNKEVEKEPSGNGNNTEIILQTKQSDCGQMINPANGGSYSNKNELQIKASLGKVNATAANITIYKISNDPNFLVKSKEDVRKKYMGNHPALYSEIYEKEAKETGFNPLKITARVKGNEINEILEKGKLSDGCYRIVILSNNNCPPMSAAFSSNTSNCTHTVNIKSISCIGNADNQGKSKYRVCVDYYNTKTTPCTSCEILLNNPANNGGTVIQSNSTSTVISNISTIPMSISAGSWATICFDAEVSSGSGLSFWVLGTCQDGLETSAHPNMENSLFDEVVKPCICDFCEKEIEFDNDQPITSITGNTLSIIQNLWANTAPGTTVVSAKAEIVSFERKVSDECMPCDKNSDSWGNFIAGNLGSTAGIFGNANGGVTGSSHHTIYFASPTNYTYNLSISLPPLTSLSCCCDYVKIKIRYTKTFKDKSGVCKSCSVVFEYEAQKGTCTSSQTSTGGGTKQN